MGMRKTVYLNAVRMVARQQGIRPEQVDRRVIEALAKAARDIPWWRLPVIWWGAKCWAR